MEKEEIKDKQNELITNVNTFRKLIELKYGKREHNTIPLNEPIIDSVAKQTKRSFIEDVNTDYKAILEDVMKLKNVQVRVIASFPKNFFIKDTCGVEKYSPKDFNFAFVNVAKSNDIHKKNTKSQV